MSRKRYAPLINIGAGLLACGESIGRLMNGDMEGALYSVFATVYHFGSGIMPYISHDEGINRFSAIENGILGANAYLKILNNGPSKSLSYNIFPLISMFQIGANAAEYSLRDK
ncbi:MAG: hypothetical protein QXD43_01285 [Candidatus Aenigmatarchaeota archaeon]